jgi:integrase
VELTSWTTTISMQHPGSLSQPLSDQTIHALLARARGEWMGLILMGRHAGQRLREIPHLSWLSVDWEGDRLRFHTTKTRLMHDAPMTAALRQYLETLPKPSELGGPLWPESAKQILAVLDARFKNLATAAGVDAWGFGALRVTSWLRSERQLLASVHIMHLVGPHSNEARPASTDSTKGR